MTCEWPLCIANQLGESNASVAKIGTMQLCAHCLAQEHVVTVAVLGEVLAELRAIHKTMVEQTELHRTSNDRLEALLAKLPSPSPTE